MRSRLVRLGGIGSLALMALASGSAQDAGYEYQQREIVQGTVDDVMARPEFRRLADATTEDRANPPWLQWILDWLEAWLEGVEASEESSSGLGIFGYVLAFIVVVGAVLFIVKTVLGSATERDLARATRAAPPVRADAAPGETAPDEFWNRAHDLAAAGNEKLAIRELLLGAMSTLERRGLIRFRRGLTNRDYLLAASGDVRASLATIVDAFERIYFGRRQATADGFVACADAYRQSFIPRSGDVPEPV